MKTLGSIIKEHGNKWVRLTAEHSLRVFVFDFHKLSPGARDVVMEECDGAEFEDQITEGELVPFAVTSADKQRPARLEDIAQVGSLFLYDKLSGAVLQTDSGEADEWAASLDDIEIE